MKTSIVAAAVALLVSTGLSFAQNVDPQSVMNALIQQQLQRRQDEQAREHLDLERQLYYRRLTDDQVLAQIEQYCPALQSPCPADPPHALLQEGADRGLIYFRNPPPSSDWPGMSCITTPDGIGGATTDCQ